MKNMIIIDEDRLNNLIAEAKASPRLRMNFNLHDSLEAKAQRLLNALTELFYPYTATDILPKPICC